VWAAAGAAGHRKDDSARLLPPPGVCVYVCACVCVRVRVRVCVSKG
jgi:hypothetical protein